MGVVGALALTGCGQAGQGEATTEDGRTPLTMWTHSAGNPAELEVYERIISDFNASQDQVEVKTNIMPWDTLYQKVLTAVAGNDGPQIIAMSASRLPQFADQGLFQPVDDYYTDPANDSAALAPAAVQATEFDGKKFGVPVNYTPMMMYIGSRVASKKT